MVGVGLDRFGSGLCPVLPFPLPLSPLPPLPSLPPPPPAAAAAVVAAVVVVVVRRLRVERAEPEALRRTESSEGTVFDSGCSAATNRTRAPPRRRILAHAHAMDHCGPLPVCTVDRISAAGGESVSSAVGTGAGGGQAKRAKEGRG